MALRGVHVVEFAGLAPAPFAGLVLADWGASVVRVDRPSPSSSSSAASASSSPSRDVLARGKRSLAVDAKTPAGRAVLLKLISRADVLLDPFRPGVLERLGLGPEVFLGESGDGEGGANGRLVYARIAGFSPTGPHRDMAGHDINYLALSGVLSMFPGTRDAPAFPLNLLADFGGGGQTCALGVLLALVERARSGRGQVVDVDMVSGTRYLASYPLISASHPPSAAPLTHPMFPSSPPATSGTDAPRMAHALDGGAPFYGVYACADARWLAVGCLEPRFYAAFVARFVAALPADFAFVSEEEEQKWARGGGQYDVQRWPAMRAFFERGFRTRGRDYWAGVFHGSDACAVPVLSPAEAAALAAGSLSELPYLSPASPNANPRASTSADTTTAHSGVNTAREAREPETTPAPHPRLSRTPATRPRPGPASRAAPRPGIGASGGTTAGVGASSTGTGTTGSDQNHAHDQDLAHDHEHDHAHDHEHDHDNGEGDDGTLAPGAHTYAILRELGYGTAEIRALALEGALGADAMRAGRGAKL